jgi:hypothetical protein
MFDDRIISSGSWALVSQIHTGTIFNCEECTYKEHNNPRKEDDRTPSIQNVMASLTPNELCQFCLMRELFQKMLP